MNGTEKLIEALKENLNSTTKKEENSSAMKVGLYPTVVNEELHLSNFNLTTMAKKLNEEAVEVMESVAYYQMDRFEKCTEFLKDATDDLIQELLDVSQMALNMLSVIKTTTGADIDEMILKHNKKLIDRGWEFDNSLSLKIINNEVEE